MREILLTPVHLVASQSAFFLIRGARRRGVTDSLRDDTDILEVQERHFCEETEKERAGGEVTAIWS